MVAAVGAVVVDGASEAGRQVAELRGGVIARHGIHHPHTLRLPACFCC